MPPPRGFPNPLLGPGDYDVTTQVHSDTYAAIAPTQFDLKGKAVLVTGGTRGIGRGVTLAYAQAGASHIAVVSSTQAPEDFVPAIEVAAKAAGRPAPRVLTLAANVADEASIMAAAKAVEAAFGKLDVVVNNAGVLSGMAPVLESDTGAWFRNFEVNVKGAYLVARAFLPLLLASAAPAKYLVQTASVGAHLTAPGVSGYQISKLAMLRFSQFVHNEYKDQGVISFAIHPGNVKTGMTERSISMREEFPKVFIDTPELCGDSLVYLTAHDRAWIGGRYINVTWDLPELMAKEAEIVNGDKLKLSFAY